MDPCLSRIGENRRHDGREQEHRRQAAGRCGRSVQQILGPDLARADLQGAFTSMRFEAFVYAKAKSVPTAKAAPEALATAGRGW